MDSFNRQKLMENINEIIKQKNLKIGEVEAAIGVSAGYISRLTKKETENAPATDIIWKLSKYLDVSMDMLIEGDFSKAMDNLKYMRNFIQRLKNLTDDNKIEWDAITTSDVNKALEQEENILPIIADKINSNENKSVDIPNDYNILNGYSLEEYGNKKIKSAATHERVRTNGSGFKAYIGQGTIMYIFKMSVISKSIGKDGNEGTTFYDIYFNKFKLKESYDGSYCPPDESDYVDIVTPVCNTLNNAHDIADIVEALYISIKRHESDLKIDPDVRNVIDEFMNQKPLLPFN